MPAEIQKLIDFLFREIDSDKLSNIQIILLSWWLCHSVCLNKNYLFVDAAPNFSVTVVNKCR